MNLPRQLQQFKLLICLSLLLTTACHTTSLNTPSSNNELASINEEQPPTNTPPPDSYDIFKRSKKNKHMILDDNRCVIPYNSTDSAICEFIRTSCNTHNFKYIELFYCASSSSSFPYSLFSKFPDPLIITAYLLLIFILLFILGLLASNYFTPNLTYLADFLNLSDKLAGLTLISLANGCPDIVSTYVAMNSKSTSLAIGELLGSANFAVTVVVGCMAIIKPFKVDFRTFIKDTMLFGCLICLSFFFLHDGKINIVESIIMCLSYVGYIFANLIAPDRYLGDFEVAHDVHNDTVTETDLLGDEDHQPRASRYSAVSGGFDATPSSNQTRSRSNSQTRSLSRTLTPSREYQDEDHFDPILPALDEYDTLDPGATAFQHNIENLENGTTFRLSLNDSLRLAFKTWDMMHIRNYYNNKSISDIEEQHQQQQQINHQQSMPQIPNTIIITSPPDDSQSSIIPYPEASLAFFPSAYKADNEAKPLPTAAVDYSNELSVPTGESVSLVRASSTNSMQSIPTSILSSIHSETHANKLRRITFLNRILPDEQYKFIKEKPFESTLNLLTLPLTLFLNLTIPTPTLSGRKQQSDPTATTTEPHSVEDNDSTIVSIFIREKRISMRLFPLQLFLAPFIILKDSSLLTYTTISIVLFTLNFTISTVFPVIYETFLFNPLASLIGFITVLRLITITASEVINILKNLAVIYSIKESLLGLTVLSIGNSIGDLITNTTLSSLGFALTGLHACFGSPLLYILFGIGLNSLIMNVKTGKSVEFELDSHLIVSATALLFTICFYIVVVPRNNWIIDRKMGIFVVGIWVLLTTAFVCGM